MRVIRTVVFWCHLVTGVTVALVVLVMSATGVLLTYQKQVTRWADTRGLDGGPRAPGARMLAPDSVLAHARALVPGGAPTAITFRRAADAPVEVAFGRDRTLFVNAYTGEVLGSGSAGVRRFFRVTTDLHRWLAMPGEGRARGKAITGAANLGFLFLVLSGLWLWWPRNWTRRAVRNVAVFRRGLAGKARDFNRHNTVGFWSLAPLAIVVVSAAVISYPWATALVYRAFGEAPPPRSTSAEGQGARGSVRPVAYPQLASVRALADARMPTWRSATVQLPRAEGRSFAIALDAGSGGEPQKRATLTLDRATGKQTRWETFASGSPARRARSILRFAHTGEVGGIVGQTIAGFLSLGAMLLVWTGLALTWRRWRAWRARTGLASLPLAVVSSPTEAERVA